MLQKQARTLTACLKLFSAAKTELILFETRWTFYKDLRFVNCLLKFIWLLVLKLGLVKSTNLLSIKSDGFKNIVFTIFGLGWPCRWQRMSIFFDGVIFNVCKHKLLLKSCLFFSSFSSIFLSALNETYRREIMRLLLMITKKQNLSSLTLVSMSLRKVSTF